MGVTIKTMEQRSKEWHAEKLGKFGGSRASDLFDKDCKLKKATDSRDAVGTLIFKLLSEVATGFSSQNIFVNDAMQWGIDNEAPALDLFLKNANKYLKLTPCGYAQNDKYELAGISPDAILTNSKGEVTEGVEIKCPESHTHLKYIYQNEIPKEYLQQVILYFVIFDTMQKMTFVSYDPRNPQNEYHEIIITREQSSELITNMEEGILQFERRYYEIAEKIKQN